MPQKLEDKELRKEFENQLSENKRIYDGQGKQKQLEKNILEAATEVCGITSGKRGRERETWWWNGIVQQNLAEKKIAFKKW